jgi:hypothetical protein
MKRELLLFSFHTILSWQVADLPISVKFLRDDPFAQH